MPRFSANLGFLWQELPLLQRIEAAARAGFGAVEMHWPYDDDPKAVRALCARLGLEVLGVNTPLGGPGEFGLGAQPGREAEFRAGFEKALAWQVEAGGNAIHCMAGVVSGRMGPEPTGVFAQNLRIAAEKAAPHGVTLLLEPLNPYDRPEYFYSTTREAMAMIARVGAPNLKLMFDVYHVGVSEGDVLRKLERLMPHIGHVQVAAVPSRAEPDEGEINYPAVFAALDRLRYAGWVGAEYRPRRTTDEGLGWLLSPSRP